VAKRSEWRREEWVVKRGVSGEERSEWWREEWVAKRGVSGEDCPASGSCTRCEEWVAKRGVEGRERSCTRGREEGGVLHTKREVLHAKRGVLHAKRGVLHAKRGVLHAKRGVLHAKRGVLHAKRGVRHAKSECWGVTRARTGEERVGGHERARHAARPAVPQADLPWHPLVFHRPTCRGTR
jgi:hypothetical protein